MKVPTFPNFTDVNPTNVTAFRALVARFPPYTEFNYTNIYAWHGGVRLSRIGETLVTCTPNSQTSTPAYRIIGSGNCDDVLQRLLELPPNIIYRVPAFILEGLEHPERFSTAEDRDNAEYLLSTRYHSELLGAGNATRRYQIKKCLTEHGDSLRATNLNLLSDTIRQEIMTFVTTWANIRGKDPAESEAESTALLRILPLADTLGLQAIGLYIDNTLSAFSLFEYAQNATAVVHFEKVDVRHTGLAHVMRHTVAKHLLANNIQFINYEQDLGIAGLRKAKIMLHPVDFLKKYSVQLR